MTETPNDPPQTASQLARKLGVSRQLVAAHRRRPGAPDLADVPGWNVWLAAVGREQSGPPKLREQIARKRLHLLGILADRERVKLANDRGQTVRKDQVQFALRKAMGVLFAGLEQFCDEWGAALPGLGA